jgi:hypothetical protein
MANHFVLSLDAGSEHALRLLRRHCTEHPLAASAALWRILLDWARRQPAPCLLAVLQSVRRDTMVYMRQTLAIASCARGAWELISKATLLQDGHRLRYYLDMADEHVEYANSLEADETEWDRFICRGHPTIAEMMVIDARLWSAGQKLETSLLSCLAP